MVSWDWRSEDSWDCSTRYQAELDAADRLRMREGWQPLVGYRQEPLEMCPAHGYGLVRGRCGVCVMEDEARSVAA